MGSANYLEQLKLMPTWPARMRREVAALYVGPVSPAQFDELVERGIMPKPVYQGNTPVWLKEDIDRLSRTSQNGVAGVASSTSDDWDSAACNV